MLYGSLSLTLCSKSEGVNWVLIYRIATFHYHVFHLWYTLHGINYCTSEIWVFQQQLLDPWKAKERYGSKEDKREKELAVDLKQLSKERHSWTRRRQRDRARHAAQTAEQRDLGRCTLCDWPHRQKLCYILPTIAHISHNTKKSALLQSTKFCIEFHFHSQGNEWPVSIAIWTVSYMN